MSRKKSIYDKKICERIKELRSKLAFTGIEFAEKVGISQGYLSDIENIKAFPGKTLLLAISYIYNVNIDWLLTGEGEMIRKPGEKFGVAENSTYIYKEEDSETAGLISMTREILKSDTDYSASLAANIRSFHHAIRTAKRINGMESRLATLEAERKKSNQVRKEDTPIEKEEFIKKRAM
jgi:transcriptional regulator with XRE-family HTH domain